MRTSMAFVAARRSVAGSMQDVAAANHPNRTPLTPAVPQASIPQAPAINVDRLDHDDGPATDWRISSTAGALAVGLAFDRIGFGMDTQQLTLRDIRLSGLGQHV